MKVRLNKVKEKIKDFKNNFFKVLRRPEMIILPGNLSFSFILAIVPSLGLISYGASVLNLSTDFLYNFMAKSFSKEIADIVLGVHLDGAVGFKFIIALLVGFYVASNGADSIITSSNAIYGIENKSWLKRRIKAFGLTFLIVLILIFMLVIPVFGNTIINLVNEVNLNAMITNRIVLIINLLQGPISWLIIFIITRMLYTLAPDGKPRKRTINYGALFTSVGWVITTKIYSIYVTNYAEYQALYGGFASIVVLMIWVYFLSYIFTIGIALNNQKDQVELAKSSNIN